MPASAPSALPTIRTTVDERDLPGTRLVNAVSSKIEDFARQCSPCAACAPEAAGRRKADAPASVELDAPHVNDGSSPRASGAFDAPWTDTYKEFRDASASARAEVVASQLDEINERLAADLSALEGGACDGKFASPVVVREVAGMGK